MLERGLARLEGGTLEVHLPEREDAPVRGGPGGRDRGARPAALPADRDAGVDRARRVVHGGGVGRTTISPRCSSCCSGTRRRGGAAPHLRRLFEAPPRPNRRNGLLRARRNIAYHYDLGNELFALMLDETMTYSCAVFEDAREPLADAQRRKLRRVCDKLELGPDDRVLEIGCGWGSFAILAAQECGCRVTGLTISPAQAALARERVARPASGTWSRSARRTTALTVAATARWVDRDARGDRREAIRHLLRRHRPPARTPWRGLRPDDPRARRPLGALPAQARLDRALRLPRLPDPVALGAGGGRRRATHG